MRTTVTIADETMRELLALTATESKTQAVSTAVEEYVRHRRLQQLRSYRGRVGILSNGEIEAAELEDLDAFDE